MCIMFDRAASTFFSAVMLKASWLLSIICECLILARHVMCEQSSIIRLPILHCKPLQLKGFVPVLVLLRMTNSDSDIHSRRPLFWAPADGEALAPNLQSTTVNWRLGYASKTELHGVMQLLGSAGNHHCSVSYAVQQRLAKHWTDLGSAEGNVQICGALSCCVFQDYRSRGLASKMAYVTAAGLFFDLFA